MSDYTWQRGLIALRADQTEGLRAATTAAGAEWIETADGAVCDLGGTATLRLLEHLSHDPSGDAIALWHVRSENHAVEAAWATGVGRALRGFLDTAPLHGDHVAVLVGGTESMTDGGGGVAYRVEESWGPCEHMDGDTTTHHTDHLAFEDEAWRAMEALETMELEGTLPGSVWVLRRRDIATGRSSLAGVAGSLVRAKAIAQDAAGSKLGWQEAANCIWAALDGASLWLAESTPVQR